MHYRLDNPIEIAKPGFPTESGNGLRRLSNKNGWVTCAARCLAHRHLEHSCHFYRLDYLPNRIAFASAHVQGNTTLTAQISTSCIEVTKGSIPMPKACS